MTYHLLVQCYHLVVIPLINIINDNASHLSVIAAMNALIAQSSTECPLITKLFAANALQQKHQYQNKSL